MQKLKVIISSVQKEFAGERMHLARYFRHGDIERYGTRTLEMYKLMNDRGLNPPLIALDEGFKLTVWKPSVDTGQATRQATGEPTEEPTAHDTGHATGHATGQAGGELGGEPGGEPTDQVTEQIPELIKRLVIVLIGEMSLQELMDSLDLRHKPNFRSNYINPSKESGMIGMTDPDNPNSPQQRYYLTAKGIELKRNLKNRP